MVMSIFPNDLWRLANKETTLLLCLFYHMQALPSTGFYGNYFLPIKFAHWNLHKHQLAKQEKPSRKRGLCVAAAPLVSHPFISSATVDFAHWMCVRLHRWSRSFKDLKCAWPAMVSWLAQTYAPTTLSALAGIMQTTVHSEDQCWVLNASPHERVAACDIIFAASTGVCSATKDEMKTDFNAVKTLLHSTWPTVNMLDEEESLQFSCHLDWIKQDRALPQWNEQNDSVTELCYHWLWITL